MRIRRGVALAKSDRSHQEKRGYAVRAAEVGNAPVVDRGIIRVCHLHHPEGFGMTLYHITYLLVCIYYQPDPRISEVFIPLLDLARVKHAQRRMRPTAGWASNIDQLSEGVAFLKLPKMWTRLEAFAIRGASFRKKWTRHICLSGPLDRDHSRTKSAFAGS